jgi:hypothetical protein
MTIVVGLATPDGLVLAADSRTTAFPDATGRSRIASDSADKVFLLCDRFAVATYDSAFIGERTIAGLMAEFIANLDGEIPSSGEELAGRLGHFFHDRYAAERAAEGHPLDPAGEPSMLGFIIAGYDAGGIGRFHEVSIPGPYVEELDVSTASIGMLPRGQRDVIDRLLAGVDRAVLDSLGVDIPDEVNDALAALGYRVFFPITLQDGIDFAGFLIRTTIDMQRFSDGTHAFQVGLPGCGGPTRVAVVRPSDVEWVTPPVLRADGPAGRAEGALGG